MKTYNYDKELLEQRVFTFIYGCALRDAILEKSFEGEKAWINKVTEAIDPVKTYIDQVLRGDFKTALDHDMALLVATKDVCDKINCYKDRPTGAGTFHFGNAQKLINMTVKHVYTHAYSINAVGYSTMRENFRFCHCPLDQEMRTKVWDSYGKIFDTKERRKTLSTVNEFHKPWGNEDFDKDSQTGKEILPSRYMSFQKAIRAIIEKQNGDIFPIEYDFIEWKA